MFGRIRGSLIHSGYWNEADAGEGGSAGGSGSVDVQDDEQSVQVEGQPAEAKKPTDEEAKLLKEVMKQKTVMKELKEKLSAKDAFVSQIEELGGLDAIKELVTQKKTAEQKKMEEKGEWDRLKAQMAEEHNKNLKQLREQAEAVSAENQKLKDEISNLTVGNSFMSSKFIKDEMVIPPTKAKVLYGQHFEFVEGRAVAFDKPAGAGERTMLVDSQGEPLAFEDAIKRLVEADPDRDALIRSKAKPGAGSVAKPKQEAPADRLDRPQGVDRIAYALSKGLLKK